MTTDAETIQHQRDEIERLQQELFRLSAFEELLTDIRNDCQQAGLSYRSFVELIDVLQPSVKDGDPTTQLHTARTLLDEVSLLLLIMSAEPPVTLVQRTARKDILATILNNQEARKKTLRAEVHKRRK